MIVLYVRVCGNCDGYPPNGGGGHIVYQENPRCGVPIFVVVVWQAFVLAVFRRWRANVRGCEGKRKQSKGIQ